MRLHLQHLLVISVTAASARSDGGRCENSQIQDILRTNSEHSCSPRRVIVEVGGAWNLSLLAPSHLEVSRCVGSCGHYHHACLPLEITTRRVPSRRSSIPPPRTPAVTSPVFCPSCRSALRHSTSCLSMDRASPTPCFHWTPPASAK